MTVALAAPSISVERATDDSQLAISAGDANAA
jgi:hypothetical protein